MANREQFDGIEVVVQDPSFEKEEKAYLNATDVPRYATREAGLQRLIELLSYEAHRRAYQTRTDLFLAMVRTVEQEGHFPKAEYVFDNGVLSRPLTTYLEEHGTYWLSELEKSRNICWHGHWRRVDSVDHALRREHPDAFRKQTTTQRRAIKTLWQASVARALRLAAQTLRSSKSALGAFYRRLASRVGPSKALTATARKLAIIFYNMVRFKKAYTDLGEDEYLKRQQQRHLARLKKQAARLGFDLVPNVASATQA